MKLRGSIVVIICCFLLQFLNWAQKRYIFSLGNSFNDIVVVCTQGLMFLVYPLLGHLADVYLTRYCTLKCGAGILVTVGITFIIYFEIFLSHIIIGVNGQYAIGCLIGIVVTIGIGLLEANTIQFGLDQLLEAPTPKLITFIHWYYILESECWRIGYVLHLLHWYLCYVRSVHNVGEVWNRNDNSTDSRMFGDVSCYSSYVYTGSFLC